LIYRVKVVVIAIDVTGCYGDCLYSHDTNKESSEWLCDRCFCGYLTDVRILFAIQNLIQLFSYGFRAHNITSYSLFQFDFMSHRLSDK